MLQDKEEHILGYSIAYKTSNRSNAKEWYLCFEDGKVCKTDAIIYSTYFNTKDEALDKAKPLNDDRLYVVPYTLTEVEFV